VAPTAVPTEAPTQAPTTAAVSFAKDILPVFEQSCVKCHGGEKTEEGLSLKTYEDVLKGSKNGAVIEPGNPANSYLVDQIAKGKMPKRAQRLSDEIVLRISDWVAAGAPNN
jgi:mono/diheme cytochrome c family protein